MSCKLSEGALLTLMNGGEVIEPIVQVLGHKKIAGNGMTERIRLLISDGINVNGFAMLATQLNEKVHNGELADFSIVKINRHIISSVNNSSDKGSTKRVLIILDLSVLVHGEEMGSKIGDPMPLSDIVMPSPKKPSNNTTPSKVNSFNQPSTGAAFAYESNRTATSNYNQNRSLNDTSDVKQSHPIVSLNPYQSRWVIKARVVAKTAIRTWSKVNSEGKLFSMDLTDESGSIKATAFNEQCDKFYDMIELNKVFYISRAQLKPANKRFSSLTHDFEMSFTGDTQVVPCFENDPSIPQLQYSFKPLSAIKDMETDSLADFIGICKSATDIQSLVARVSKKELKKREITLVDQSLFSVTLTLWDTQAEEFDGSLQPIVAVRSARVSEYNGTRSLSLVSSSAMQINPDITEAHRLRGWYDSLSDSTQFNNISNKVAGGEGSGGKLWTLKEARMNNVGNSDTPDYFTTEATIFFIQSNKAVYLACPSSDCNKKVLDQNNGMFRCEKCNREFPNYKYRLMVPLQICDWSGIQWVTAFQDHAEILLGATAQEIGTARDQFDNYASFFRKSLFKTFSFRLRAKMETFNNETRLKMTVVNAKPLDYKESCRNMLNEIKQISGVSLIE